MGQDRRKEMKSDRERERERESGRQHLPRSLSSCTTPTPEKTKRSNDDEGE